MTDDLYIAQNFRLELQDVRQVIVQHQDWADPWHGAVPGIVLGADLLYDPGELHLQNQAPPACLSACICLSSYKFACMPETC